MSTNVGICKRLSIIWTDVCADGLDRIPWNDTTDKECQISDL